MASRFENLSQHWARLTQRLGSRQRTTEILKTLVIVVPLTLLIWVYAERAQTVYDTVDFAPKVSVNEPGLVAELESATNMAVSIQLDLNGPHTQIESLKSEISQRLMRDKLALALPSALSHPGKQNVDVANAFNSDPLFANSGVTIIKATPSYVTVNVNRLKPTDLVVKLPTDGLYPLQNVTFDPPRITVTGPEPVVLREYPGANDQSVTVDLRDQSAALAGTGTKTIDVKLILPTTKSLVFSTDHVKMTCDLTTSNREITLPPFPLVVQKLAAQESLQQVVLKGQPLIQNVRVSGPGNVISKMEGDNPSIRPVGVLQVLPADTGKSDINRPIIIQDLPPEVKLISGAPSVDFDVNAVAQ